MDKVRGRTLTLLLLAMLVVYAVWLPVPARAQSQLQPTQILIGAPATANVGEALTVQAVLADAQGYPISKAPITFTTRATFIGESGEVEVAQAVTNAQGQATATFIDNISGLVVLKAEFRGDDQYASSNATTQIQASGDRQVYVDHIGVDLPGLTVPPRFGGAQASLQSTPGGIVGLLASLWPAMNGWPLAAALLLVWSMYFLAVTFVFRVANLGNEPDEAGRPQ